MYIKEIQFGLRKRMKSLKSGPKSDLLSDRKYLFKRSMDTFHEHFSKAANNLEINVQFRGSFEQQF